MLVTEACVSALIILQVHVCVQLQTRTSVQVPPSDGSITLVQIPFRNSALNNISLLTQRC